MVLPEVESILGVLCFSETRWVARVCIEQSGKGSQRINRLQAGPKILLALPGKGSQQINCLQAGPKILLALPGNYSAAETRKGLLLGIIECRSRLRNSERKETGAQNFVFLCSNVHRYLAPNFSPAPCLISAQILSATFLGPKPFSLTLCVADASS